MKKARIIFSVNEEDGKILRAATEKFCLETGRRNISATIRYAVAQYVGSETKVVINKLIGQGRLGVEQVDGKDYLKLKV